MKEPADSEVNEMQVSLNVNVIISRERTRNFKLPMMIENVITTLQTSGKERLHKWPDVFLICTTFNVQCVT